MSGPRAAQVPGAPVGLGVSPATDDCLFRAVVTLDQEPLFGYLGERSEEHGSRIGAQSCEVVGVEPFPFLQAGDVGTGYEGVGIDGVDEEDGCEACDQGAEREAVAP